MSTIDMDSQADAGRQLQLQAQAHVKAGEFSAAVAVLERLETILSPPSALLEWVLAERMRLEAFEFRRLETALQISTDAIDRFPASRSIWFSRGRILAQIGRLADATHAFKRALRLDPASGAIAYEIVKIMQTARRPEAVLAFGARALDGGVRAPTLFANLAAASLLLREPDLCLDHLQACEDAAPLNDHLQRLRERALRMKIFEAASRRRAAAPRVRHITVGGRSYSGTTLLGALLGSLEGAAHAGETQELIQRYDKTLGVSPLIDFANDSDAMISHCRVCGPDCAVLTRAFRASLRRDPVDFYYKLGRHLDVATLITSDKFIIEYTTKDPLSDFDLIVLYKPPLHWVRSYARRRLPDSPDVSKAERLRLIRSWLDHWVMTYRSLLKEIRPQGDLVVLNWEEFVARPEAHFDHLVGRLGLAGGSGVFSRVTPGHYVGGNMTGSVMKVMRSGHIDFKQSDAPPLPSDEEQIVAEHAEAQALYAQLQSRYRGDFAVVIADAAA
jgi:tetratricopeptide (TPR) repeat protein